MRRRRPARSKGNSGSEGARVRVADGGSRLFQN